MIVFRGMIQQSVQLTIHLAVQLTDSRRYTNKKVITQEVKNLLCQQKLTNARKMEKVRNQHH